MTDRSSRPHRQPQRTPQPTVRAIVHLRWRKRLGPVAIGARLGVPASTVHAVLVRCRLNRLSHVDRRTGEPIRRYEHDRPGAMLHVDVKKLGNVPDGGGWRYVGRAQVSATGPRPSPPPASPAANTTARCWGPRSCTPSSTTTPASPTPRSTTTRPPPPPWRSYIAPWPGTPPAASPWNGCFRTMVRPTAPGSGPAPATNSGSDRRRPAPTGHRPTARSNASPHPRRRLGLRPPVPQRVSPPTRPARLAPRVQPSPAPHRDRKRPTHHQAHQPAWAVHRAVEQVRVLVTDQPEWPPSLQAQGPPAADHER